jgi:hypothetical protein
LKRKWFWAASVKKAFSSDAISGMQRSHTPYDRPADFAPQHG